MRKIFPKKQNVEKPVATAHVHGKNVIEIKRGKDIIKIIGEKCQVMVTDPIEHDKLITVLEIDNGELVTSADGDIIVKEYDDKGNEITSGV